MTVDHCVRFSFGDTVIVSKPAQITFSDIKKFKFKNSPTATVDTNQFVQALKLLKIFALENADNIIDLKLTEKDKNSVGVFSYSINGAGEFYRKSA